MRYLLDVNLIVALIDPDHVHSNVAHNWWIETGRSGWASCPLTENGAIRILSNPNYSSTYKFTPEFLIGMLQAFAERYDHEFWPDDVSLRDENVFVPEMIFGPRQITDIYLLALAIKHDGCFVTFDTGISTSAVANVISSSLFVIDTFH